MKIEDIALLMGKTRQEMEEMLKQNDIIELNLTEKNNRKIRESGEIKIVE
ncbi:MAG: hypothetical protein IH949_09660 [Bacteroidetes bacterium]|nr:hypothetical protein [Bacteroidota bacterium]